MAKEKLITRTVKTVKVKFLITNIEAKSVEELEHVLPYAKKESDILKMLKDIFETETNKVAAIVSTEISEQKYGMAESQFIAEATVIE